jgi:hypothetical protein
MAGEESSGRRLKKTVLKQLQKKDFEKGLARIRSLPPRKAVNPLFSFFFHQEPLVKWRAVSAMGALTASLAEKDMESARVVMRRLMWSLNDESGGIGWGSPEAMGEIMAQSHALAREYASILIEFTRETGNYIEHPLLQQGVLWGVGRLAGRRPDLARDGIGPVSVFLGSDDPVKRGLAAWALAPLRFSPEKAILDRLLNDRAELDFYSRGEIRSRPVQWFARAFA